MGSLGSLTVGVAERLWACSRGVESRFCLGDAGRKFNQVRAHCSDFHQPCLLRCKKGVIFVDVCSIQRSESPTVPAGFQIFILPPLQQFRRLAGPCGHWKDRDSQGPGEGRPGMLFVTKAASGFRLHHSCQALLHCSLWRISSSALSDIAKSRRPWRGSAWCSIAPMSWTTSRWQSSSKAQWSAHRALLLQAQKTPHELH